MTPIDRAKEKVYEIFHALDVDRDVVWKEHVRGFYRVQTGLHGNILCAEISREGGLAVVLKSTECTLLLCNIEYGEIQQGQTVESWADRQRAKERNCSVTLDSSPEAETSAKPKDKKP